MWYYSAMTTTNAYQQAAQARTLDTATRTGTHWTQAELDKVSGRPGTLEQVALELGRTLYSATYAAQRATEGNERTVTRPTRRELPADRGWTTCDDMGYW